MTGLFKDKLQFDPNYLEDSDNVGAFLRDGYGQLITSTTTGSKHAIDVNLVNTDLVNNGVFLEDSPHTSGDKGMFTLGVRNDTNAVLTSTDGDYSPFAVDSAGRMKVVADISVASDFVYAEDSVAASGDLGAFILATRADNMPANANTSADGDYASFFVDAFGAQWVDAVGSRFDGAADTITTDGRDRAVKMGTRTVAAPLAASVAGVRADVISDIYRRIYINDSPNVAAAVAPVAVNDTAGGTQLSPAALGSRRRLMIQNLAKPAIYVGNSGVTTSGGLRIAGGATLVLEAGPSINLYAITDTGQTADVRVFEVG